MNAADKLKAAIFNTIEELKVMEDYARNNEESYDRTVTRLNTEGYLDGLNYALTLLATTEKESK